MSYLLRTDVVGFPVNELRVAHLHIPAAKVVAADPDGILKGTALPDTAGAVKIFLAQPLWPMNLTMVCSGTQTGKAVVEGLDFADNLIEEEFTLTSATPVVGVKAFKRVTKISLPQKAGSETIDVGWGVKFGLPDRLSADELCIVKLFNGAADAGTLTVDADDLAKNVYELVGIADGKKAIDLYYLR